MKYSTNKASRLFSRMGEDVNIPNSKCFELLNNKEERKAFECYLENSKTGDSMANYMVAEMYLNGSGVEANEKKHLNIILIRMSHLLYTD